MGQNSCEISSPLICLVSAKQKISHFYTPHTFALVNYINEIHKPRVLRRANMTVAGAQHIPASGPNTFHF
jgi:hypothetical protein